MNPMLEERLRPLANRLKEAVEKGNSEANSRGTFYSGQAVVLKTKYWLDALAELLEIHTKYSSEHELEQINRFIDSEQRKLTKTFALHGLSSNYDKLESGVKDLKILLQDQSSTGGDNVNDLKNKTDEELRDIMRASINNSYVPSSIYHKAKQELEFRTVDPRPKSSDTFTQNFHGPIGTVGVNHGKSLAGRQVQKTKRKFWENPLFLTILAGFGALIVAYLTYRLRWNK